MKALVNKNQKCNASICNHDKNVGEKDDNKDGVNRVLGDIQPLQLQCQAVECVVFHQPAIRSEITDRFNNKP